MSQKSILKSLNYKKSKFRIASWNIQGLGAKKESLLLDFEHYKMDICCLQETKSQEIIEKASTGLFLTLPTSSPHYGLGFIIARKWIDNILHVESLSDRLAVIHLQFTNYKRKNSKLTIINAYAPTSTRVADHPEEAEQFYEDLKNLYNHHSSSSLLVICGDFNAKLGKQQCSDEQFMGHFGKGSRNNNGELLAEFMIMNGLFATNTNFRHSSRHISSWHGCINDHLYHNQIDYILCKQHYKSLFTDSRTHSGTITSSDHSVVISTLQLSKYYTISSNKHRINNTYDTKARKYLTTHPEKQGVGVAHSGSCLEGSHSQGGPLQAAVCGAHRASNQRRAIAAAE
jgi:exonuclease III